MPSAMECHIAFLADGVLGGSGNFQSAAMMNRKLMASKKKAQATPNAWITKPAGTGPTMVVSCAVLWLTEDAATSCSRLTSEGTYADCAGAANASATPKATARAYSSQICKTRSQTSQPITVTQAVRAVAVANMILRADMRSLTAPPMSIRAARGIAPAIMIAPMATAEPVCCNTSHGKATR